MFAEGCGVRTSATTKGFLLGINFEASTESATYPTLIVSLDGKTR